MGTFYEVIYRQTQRSIFWEEVGTIQTGDFVVIDADGRPEIGKVVWQGEGEVGKGAETVEKGAIRKATDEDKHAFLIRRQKETSALQVFTEKIAEHELPMRPVEVEYEEDGSRITFYFTAENRVDFRELVRDLAHIYHTRIELRQINLRLAIQRFGGCGSCGRPLCCATFMKVLHPVPARIAQDQSLSQNLSKLVGACGQLKCCLRYELDFYREAKDRFPPVGSRICCRGGACRIEKHNIFEDFVRVRRQDGEVQDLPLAEVERMQQGDPT